MRNLQLAEFIARETFSKNSVELRVVRYLGKTHRFNTVIRHAAPMCNKMIETTAQRTAQIIEAGNANIRCSFQLMQIINKTLQLDFKDPVRTPARCNIDINACILGDLPVIPQIVNGIVGSADHSYIHLSHDPAGRKLWGSQLRVAVFPNSISALRIQQRIRDAEGTT
nr:Metabolism_regulation [Citrobacter werkmanii]